MKPLDLNFICQTLTLPTPSENKPVSRIVTDSRDIRAGDVFFALAGERFDAHDFVEDVLAAGAAAVVVSREDCAAMDGALKVDDTLAALQTLAKAWRNNVDPFVFGITGSGGKTTVKEMLAAVLRRRFGDDAVLATAGNFNNHIGLPLTLLKLNEKHRYAVIEMGMNHFGELAVLTQIAKPDAALVNNALRAHVGCGFDGTFDIAKAKSEIYQGLGEDGLALIPCEDEHAAVFQTTSQSLKRLDKHFRTVCIAFKHIEARTSRAEQHDIARFGLGVCRLNCFFQSGAVGQVQAAAIQIATDLRRIDTDQEHAFCLAGKRGTQGREVLPFAHAGRKHQEPA